MIRLLALLTSIVSLFSLNIVYASTCPSLNEALSNIQDGKVILGNDTFIFSDEKINSKRDYIAFEESDTLHTEAAPIFPPRNPHTIVAKRKHYVFTPTQTNDQCTYKLPELRSGKQGVIVLHTHTSYSGGEKFHDPIVLLKVVD